MAKNRHTFAKRQREIEKKRKADEKRDRRHGKNQAEAETGTEGQNDIESPERTDV